jgi:hypothetical protein
VGETLQQHPVRSAPVQGVGIVPSFSENLEQVSYYGAAQLECGIVPRGSSAVPGVHGDGLRVSRVVVVVPATVSKIESANECNVL